MATIHGISAGFCTIYMVFIVNDSYNGTIVATIASTGTATLYATGTSLIAHVLAAALKISSCYDALTSFLYKVSNTALTIVFITLPVTFTWPLENP